MHRSEVRVTKYGKTQLKCMIWNSSADPPDPPDPAEVVSRSAARTPPSTRAGGQDDVSLHKLPQTKEFTKRYIRPDILFPTGPDLLFRIGAGIALQGLITQVYT